MEKNMEHGMATGLVEEHGAIVTKIVVLDSS